MIGPKAIWDHQSYLIPMEVDQVWVVAPGACSQEVAEWAAEWAEE